ncbi:DNA polymerase IV [Aggregatibacter actinomycetemcomitans serotype e str. SC936]|uniref:DNA polymerase IV n=1 Tax=Aggregatibacter actinomycetemcomitans TaxID=714 RepID=UPI000796B71F|nr:DNA polymerase IV [Aggregatibacter actinomycetemcomitans]KYK79895.1 DNA polymerase IV [Aggregatibacter actinomycetemcomitans serotype e str. SC936]
MKFFKFVTLLSLSSAFIFNAAFAAEPNTKGKVQTTQQTKQKTKNTQEGALSQFKKSIDIHFEERDIVVDDDNQAYVLVKYSVENKSNKCAGSATWIAQDIRSAIFNELHLTASAGVAPLKFLAKIASDQNKPNGQFVIEPKEVADFVAALPLKKIPGVGKVTSEKLLQMVLATCANVQKYDRNALFNLFGKMGQRIWAYSHGIDERPVQPHRERKSVGVEITLLENIEQLDQGEAVLRKLYSQLVARVQCACPNMPLTQFRKIGVKLKFEDFQVTTLEKSAVDFSEENFHRLLAQIWLRKQGRSVRLIGLHVTFSEEKQSEQMSLW